MSSVHHTSTDDRKSSSLPENIRAPMTEAASEAETSKGVKGGGKGTKKRRGSRQWVAVLVDLLLLLALAGLVTGAVFGFRAVRELYAPTWETRTVVYTVEIQGIDPGAVKYNSDGRYIYIDNPMWSSVYTDADCLGTVTDVKGTRVTAEDGSSTLTLILTVEADAAYREGKGYRMGETMLLAGMTGEFRMEGMAATGTVISMQEKSILLQEAQTTGPDVLPEEAPDGESRG